VDLFARRPKIIRPRQLFCAGTIGVAGSPDLAALLRGIVFIREPQLCLALDLKRTGLRAVGCEA
jgi:hypothetical protein